MTPYFTEKMRNYFFLLRVLYFASLKKSLHLFPLGRGQFQPCFKKYFAVCKNLLTYSHWEKPNAHPKSQKIFYPFTFLELRSRNAPCFYKNFEKIFFQSRALILLAQKAPSLIPTESGQLHPLNLKKIYPFTYLELGCQNATCFSGKTEKLF